MYLFIKECRMKKIRLLDTFAWVWGFHLALEQSIWKENVECIWFSEIDKFAKQVYSQRFPGAKDLWSITELDIDWLEDFDLLTGWFPCQDVSVAWKQSLEWWRTVLVEYLLQILEKKQPKYFVFENVKGLMSKKFNEFRESIFNRIEQAWYWFTYKVLNTKDFWLPQNRERVFIVWELNEKWWYFDFPKWKELTTFLKDILEEEVDEKFYMTDEQYNKLSYDSIKRIYDTISPTLDTAQWWHRQPKIKVWYNTRTREFEWTWFKEISPTLCARDFKDPKQCIKIKNNTNKWYLEWFEWDGVIEKWFKIRKLTPIEYARLQWFPNTWSTDYVSNSQAYKQMWNAISVPVVKAIFDNLFYEPKQ